MHTYKERKIRNNRKDSYLKILNYYNHQKTVLDLLNDSRIRLKEYWLSNFLQISYQHSLPTYSPT
nr:MAG TPA: hypothetical protein [Caudoviricetes sp.]